MTSPVLDKIQKLLARAAHESTPVEEARTSAVIAARLIVEHKVELRVPGTSKLWTPEAGLDFDLGDLLDEFFGKRSNYSSPHPETRTMFTAVCHEYLQLKCSCCGAPVRPGSKFGWIGDRDFIQGEEGSETIARVVHEACQQHWQQKICSACNKNTTKARNIREKLKNHRREPPGTMTSVSSGYCYCCGSTYDIGERVVQRGFVFVHLGCAGHFMRTPCPKCGGGAKF